MAKHAKTILIIDTAWTILADFHLVSAVTGCNHRARLQPTPTMTVKQLEAEDRERLRAALEE
jgi:hypothetical protein